MYRILILPLLLIISCTTAETETETEPAEAAITAEAIERHVITLSADEFMGRKPFTEGETKTIEYIRSEFQNAGIAPGNGDSYFQEVPLVEIKIDTISPMRISGKGKQIAFRYKDDFVGMTKRISEVINVDNSEIVFAGFGTVAPEYGWNDYEGLDVKGKTVVVLVNDPGFGEGNEDIFRDEAMTYYGRWTYKYEEAARQGAEAMIIIHDTAPASYGWNVVEGSNTVPKLDLQAANNNMDRVKFEGWITMDAAKELFAAAGFPDRDFTAEARKPGFKPYSLGLNMSVYLENSFNRSTSNNVIGIVKGSERPDEYIIYTAHWDHLGVGTPVDGDSIYNGAVDNATGIGALIEIGRAFAQMEDKPARSIVLLAVTAEEQGLLGSGWYASNPIYPPNKTVANLNMDALRPFGEWQDITIIGYGQSELEDYAAEVAKMQQREVSPDPAPERGIYYRSDHFNFAKIGIPALYAKGEKQLRNTTPEATKEKYMAYNKDQYHQPADEYDPEVWDFGGIVQDARFMFLTGLKIAETDKFPQWREGSEFRENRERSMGVRE